MCFCSLHPCLSFPHLIFSSVKYTPRVPISLLLLYLLADFMYPLCHPRSSFLPFRLVHSGPGKSSPLLDSDLSFGLRSGTKQGVETHVFRVDSAKELSTWTHLLVEGCHNAAELIKEVTTGAKTRDLFDSQTVLSQCLLQFCPLKSGKFNFESSLSWVIRNEPQIIWACFGVLPVLEQVSSERHTARLQIWLPLQSPFIKMNQLMVFC